jgi:rubrerythrin
MTEDTTVDILKNAILLERRGYAFYSKVASQASDPAVKQFFTLMADEETQHIQILADQFKFYQENQSFKAMSDIPGTQLIADQVLTDELKEKIGAAEYEAAAVAAAMAMEKSAIELYAGRASEATDADEKKLYAWLAEWEGTHLDFLANLDREIREKVWFDNSFWPF